MPILHKGLDFVKFITFSGGGWVVGVEFEVNAISAQLTGVGAGAELGKISTGHETGDNTSCMGSSSRPTSPPRPPSSSPRSPQQLRLPAPVEASYTPPRTLGCMDSSLSP